MGTWYWGSIETILSIGESTTGTADRCSVSIVLVAFSRVVVHRSHVYVCVLNLLIFRCVLYCPRSSRERGQVHRVETAR
jgi:hypothetical protein